jgi:hypothetical protein
MEVDKITQMLFAALTRAELKGIRSALASGAEVSSTTWAGHCPLHIAAIKCSHREVIRLLVKCGASFNGCDSHRDLLPLIPANQHISLGKRDWLDQERDGFQCMIDACIHADLHALHGIPLQRSFNAFPFEIADPGHRA